MAFASAFHCFLYGDPVFESWVSSALKVLTMVIGEYEFDSHFVYSAVKDNGGRNISIQVLTMFSKPVNYGQFICWSGHKCVRI